MRLQGIVLEFEEAMRDAPVEAKDAAVDAWVERFSSFMASLPDWRAAGPLNPSDRALVKSLFVAALSGRME